MSLRKSSLRILRNVLYRRLQKDEERFRKINRSFLRAVMPGAAPIEEAPQITNRQTDDRWKSLQPVWVLSSGRTGTETLTRLLNLSPRIDAYHEPAPELFQFSYDYYNGDIETSHALKTLLYLRDELVFRSHRDGFIFVETNNRVTYIAELLLELYPSSKFIHIYRNPYNYIRSGMRRKYYSGHMRDYARVKPRGDDVYHERWDNLTDLEKVAWNWRTVNELCLDFMNNLPDNQKLGFSSEAFFNADTNLVKNLFTFIGSDQYVPPPSDVNRVMKKKHNAQQKGQFSTPDNWTDSQVKNVNKIIANTAEKLSYELHST